MTPKTINENETFGVIALITADDDYLMLNHGFQTIDIVSQSDLFLSLNHYIRLTIHFCMLSGNKYATSMKQVSL